MRLTIEATLHGVAHALRERIAPALDDPFAAEAARLAELLVTLCAGTVDTVAAARADENAAIRALFADAAPDLADRDLAARLTADAPDPGLRIGALDTENGRLRRLLVELHAHVEALDGADARTLDARIWRLMRDAEAARQPG